MTIPQCECKNWATSDLRKTLLGNGHHPNCYSFRENVNTFKLFEDLIKIIETCTTKQLIDDELWKSYEESYFIIHGEFPRKHGT